MNNPKATTSSGSIPDLVKIKPLTTNQTIDVQTSILDPIIKNETHVRFQFDNKGILHSNSKLQFSLNCESGKRRFHPFINGIGAVVKRCVLLAGSKTIAEVEDWNAFHAFKSMFLSNEAKKEREQVLTGRVGTYEYDYETADGSSLTATKVQFDVGNEKDGTATVLPDTLNIDNKPTFQINLSDLFPFLKHTQLPLYLMKDQLSVEIHFADAENRYFAQHSDWFTEAVNTTVKATAQLAKIKGVRDEAFTFDHTKTKFIADYLLYPQDQMDNYQKQIETSGLTIPYFDYLLTKSTVTPAANKVTFTRVLGGANRICTRLIIANTAETRDLGTNTAGDRVTDKLSLTAIDNIYNSQFPASDIEMQLKYNDRNLFPRPIKSTAELFSFVQASEGVPPFILKEEWDGTRSTSVTADTLEGYALNAELKYAPKHYYAVKLNRGERVNSRGVELEMNMTMAANTPAMTQRAWLEVAKVITLKDGRMTCKEA